MKWIALGPEGNIVVWYNANPMLKSIIYEVELPDGRVNYYAANSIAENMLSQVYDEGYIVTLIDLVLYYKIDYSAIDKSYKYVVTRILQCWLINMNQG